MGWVIRILLLVLLVWLALRVLQRVLAKPRGDAEPPPPAFEPMARCAKCGVHVPAAALNAAGLCGRCAG